MFRRTCGDLRQKFAEKSPKIAESSPKHRRKSPKIAEKSPKFCRSIGEALRNIGDNSYKNMPINRLSFADLSAIIADCKKYE